MTPPSGSQQPTQHFLLKWNNHRSNMVTIFESLLQSENLVDVTLAVEGKFLKAHKIVLSACSPYFQSMFVHQTPGDKHPILIFHDMKYSHLKILLEFMYRGEISIDERELSDILKVAEALSIRGLSSFESDDEESESTQQSTEQKPEPGGSCDNQYNSSNNKGNNKSNKQAPLSSSTNNVDNHQDHDRSNKKSCDSSATHFRSSSCNSTSSSSGKISTHENGANVSSSSKRKGGKTGMTSSSPGKSKPVSSTTSVVEIKKKRGRQPKNKLVETTVQNMKAAAAKVHGCLVDPKPTLPSRQGVRRRVPRRVPPPIKREKNSADGDNGEKGGTDDQSDILTDEMLPPEFSNSEPLSEMSVRGLDLFKYASVEDGVYKCNECEKMRIPKTFKNKYSFQRHAFLYHEGNMRKVFPCPICSREFSRPDKMKNHLKSFHNGSSPSGSTASNGTPTTGELTWDNHSMEDSELHIDPGSPLTSKHVHNLVGSGEF